jgi:hypothetical protein
LQNVEVEGIAMKHQAPRDTVRTSEDSTSTQLRLRPGAWVLAVALQVLVLTWVVRTEITARVFVSSWTLSMPGILLLLVLRGWNALVRRRALTPAELLVAFVAVSSSVTIAGYNFLQLLIPTLGAGVYLATPENRWAEVLRQAPGWLVPGDRDALRGMYHGESTVPWDVWLVPLTVWGGLVLAICAATLAVSYLFSDYWIRRERLAFPIATLPMELVRHDGELFRTRGFWLGFALPVVINSLLAVNHYQPSVPALPHKHTDLLEEVATPPLAVLRPLQVGWTPFITGLAFLAPLDVSFSVWGFYWLTKVERLAAYSVGALGPADFAARGQPHLDDQALGAFLAMGGLIAWRALVGGRRTEDGARSREEARFLGLMRWIAGGALAFALGFLLAAGFPFWVGLLLITLYALMVIVIARVRSEAGFAWAYAPDRGTASLSHVIINAHGTIGLSDRTLALFGLFQWVWWDLRFALMPAQIDALKVADSAGLPRRQLAVLLFSALGVAVMVGLICVVDESYRFGWGTAKTYVGPPSGARANFNLAVNWMKNPTGPRWDKTLWMVGGGLFTLALGALRQRFVWWPFHPIGYVMCSTPTSHAFWSHYMFAWSAKLLILRYGGMRLYRSVLPLVFGVILGDVASQTGWSIVGAVLDIPVYQFVS